ncbi:MAG: BrnT family toxin [Xanthomonadales bacterium]|nr:BrnT family toxin [Xanthomonadales bacterium]
MTTALYVHTICCAQFDFDPVKNDNNIRERGLSFERVAGFDFESAVVVVDDRRDYGEVRLRALGFVGARLHALVFVETVTGIRVISFRKANKREARQYEQATQT